MSPNLLLLVYCEILFLDQMSLSLKYLELVFLLDNDLIFLLILYAINQEYKFLTHFLKNLSCMKFNLRQ